MQLLQQGAEFYCDGLINLTEHWLKHEYNRSDYVENCARVQNRIKEKHLFLFQRNISYRYEEETRTYYISARPRKIPFEKKKKRMGVRVLPRTSSSLVEISYSKMENIYTCFMA